jgi:uncharacterized membrane protein YjfL (UPF0719 family)
MTDLPKKIEHALNEGRMLMLGAQVLIGAQFLTVFQSSFDSLPRFSQYVVVGTLIPLLVGAGLLLTTPSYHQLVARGEDSAALHRFVTGLIGVALAPFALALGLDAYVAVTKLGNSTLGVIAGLVAAGTALSFWYGLEVWQRRSRPARPAPGGARPPRATEPKADGAKPPGPEQSKLDNKVKNALTEARVVLPGVQALLGFQFSTMMTQSFDKLPESSKYIHLGSLALIALSTILLMTPAAYHRIVEDGENSDRFQRFAGRMVLASLVPLAPAIAAEFFVVTRKVTESIPLAVGGALLLLALFYGLWFGLTFLLRARRSSD